MEGDVPQNLFLICGSLNVYFGAFSGLYDKHTIDEICKLKI